MTAASTATDYELSNLLPTAHGLRNLFASMRQNTDTQDQEARPFLLDFDFYQLLWNVLKVGLNNPVVCPVYCSTIRANYLQ